MYPGQLKTDRGIWKFIGLSIITFGIYSLIFFARLANDVNTVSSRYDGKKTMNFWLLMFIVGPLTLEIGTFVWYHRVCNRIGAELAHRGINYDFSASTFWGWGILGTCIIVGPFVWIHKLCNAMNYISSDYNQRGCQ
ncbi:MAG: DUF4234 domain-containing protein [Clostridia bacterium]|jgi:hypothetical protein